MTRMVTEKCVHKTTALVASGIAAVVLSGCQTTGHPPDPAAPPPLGGPRERLVDCVADAGISGKYETESWFDKGVETVSVLAGRAVSSDQADAANQCLSGAS